MRRKPSRRVVLYEIAANFDTRFSARLIANADKKQRLGDDYKVIKEIVDFFCEVVELAPEERCDIENKLFNGYSSRNRLGTINFLQDYIGDRCPGWTRIAKEHFNINY